MSSLQDHYPVMLSIAGSDCSSGAGLQADLKAGVALGSYPLTVLTCAVSEVPGLVESIVPMETDFVIAQLRLSLKSFPVSAIKAGMLYSPGIVRGVAEVLHESQYETIPLVIDPVMIASAGEPLMQQAAISAYEECLIPRASLLTPNLDEASALLSGMSITNEQELEAAGLALRAKYDCAILVKGGHLAGDHCTDILVSADGTISKWSHPRITGVSTHGTGCTLSAAIAAGMSCGQPLEQAVEAALLYTEQAIARSLRWEKPCAMQALAPRPSY